jgi:hypothetical protein
VLFTPAGTKSYRIVSYLPASPKPHCSHHGRVGELALAKPRAPCRQDRANAREGIDLKQGDPVKSDSYAAAVKARTRFRIIAAGQLDHQNYHDSLILAFAPIEAEDPDWAMLIYCEGSPSARQEPIDSHGMDRRIRPAGAAEDSGSACRHALMVHSARYRRYPNAIQETLPGDLPILTTDSLGATGALLDGRRHSEPVPSESINALKTRLAPLTQNVTRCVALMRSIFDAVVLFEIEWIGERWNAPFEKSSGRRSTITNSGIVLAW